MKITVLDGFTMNPGDLSWDALKAVGDVEIFENTAPDKVVERLKESDIAVVNKVLLTADILKELPNLKMIAVTATGFNNVDCIQASKQGVTVCNVPAYSTEAVTQMVFAHILAYTNRVAEHSSSVKKGDWEKSEQFCFTLSPISELSGKTMGVLGYGNIGKSITKVALAFGMKVIVNTRTTQEQKGEVSFVERETLLKESDYIALAAPLTPDTKECINRETLKLMKSNCFLINTGRGPLINEQDLADALKSGEIAGAGVDVLTQEPPKDGSPLISAKQCTITPHIAWASFEAREKLMGVTVNNIKSFIKNSPINVVNL